jgi:hypothetical protein
MNIEQLTRDRIITEWYFQDWIGHHSQLPDPEDVLLFMMILVDVISVTIKLSEDERKYIIGRAAILGKLIFNLLIVCLIAHVGVSQEMMNKLQTYQPDINKVSPNGNLLHVKKTRMGIIYNVFRTLGVNHKLHRTELDAIHIAAKKLGVTEEQVQQIQSLLEEEDKLREKRASILFPQGFNVCLTEYQKLH